jgi:hypothetical protein
MLGIRPGRGGEATPLLPAQIENVNELVLAPNCSTARLKLPQNGWRHTLDLVRYRFQVRGLPAH